MNNDPCKDLRIELLLRLESLIKEIKDKTVIRVKFEDSTDLFEQRRRIYVFAEFNETCIIPKV